MLKLIFKDKELGFKPGVIEGDLVAECKKVNPLDIPLVRHFIKEIEHGEYYNNKVFLNRFGIKTPLEYLSTGCKAAILLATNPPDYPLDLTEAGLNAQDEIIRYCRQGSILLPVRDSIGYDEVEGADYNIEVAFDGYNFFDIRRLNYYIMEEFRWCEADLDRPGVQKIPGEKSLIEILSELYD